MNSPIIDLTSSDSDTESTQQYQHTRVIGRKRFADDTPSASSSSSSSSSSSAATAVACATMSIETQTDFEAAPADCAVCYEILLNYGGPPKMTFGCCNNEVHVHCAFRCYQMGNGCPVCRAEFHPHIQGAFGGAANHHPLAAAANAMNNVVDLIRGAAANDDDDDDNDDDNDLNDDIEIVPNVPFLPDNAPDGHPVPVGVLALQLVALRNRVADQEREIEELRDDMEVQEAAIANKNHDIEILQRDMREQYESHENRYYALRRQHAENERLQQVIKTLEEQNQTLFDDIRELKSAPQPVHENRNASRCRCSACIDPNTI
jgi:hypothetical protein